MQRLSQRIAVEMLLGRGHAAVFRNEVAGDSRSAHEALGLAGNVLRQAVIRQGRQSTTSADEDIG